MIDESYIRESLTGALLLSKEVKNEISVDIPGIGEIVIDRSFVTILDAYGNIKSLTHDNMEGRIFEIINRGELSFEN